MTFKQALAATTLAAIAILLVPVAPTLADGAASTRNILIGGAVATYLIIEHNRKVHQQRAAEAQQNASLQEQNHQGEAAYQQEKQAYQEEVATNRQLEREVADQHAVIKQQDQRLASAGLPSNSSSSYGWGTL